MAKNNYCVYKHTSPSNKVYIGITGRNPVYRWNSGKGYKHNSYFYKSIQKYGWNNFKHEILFTGLTKEEACEKEIELISECKSNIPDCGYNISSGGECTMSGIRLSYEARMKISKAKKGIPSGRKGEHFTEEHKKKISNALSGKKKSEEHCKRIGKSKKGLFVWSKNPVAKMINKYSLSGEFIKSYDCIADALNELNISLHSGGHISDCAKGKRKTAYGFRWEYERGDA